MALPFLPGNTPNKQVLKDKFHKSQHFDYSNGLPMLVGVDKPGIGGEPLLGQNVKPKCSIYPKRECHGLPSWVAFDKQSLCFEAYFEEDVANAQNETLRIRTCRILFFLEDDTIQVVEPACKNSGIPQGPFIHRQRIPLPPPDDDQFYNIFHFNINQQMVLYSRTFTLTDCDTFTKDFLTRLGVRLNSPTTVPKDSYSTLREESEKNMNPCRPYERQDTLRQFLDHDCEVLRFYCLWDDSETMFGDPRELVLHYFLADDTIEILEVIPLNSGRDNAPKFLRRSKLPKHAPTQMRQPGAITNRTVLNVFSNTSQDRRYILDNLRTGAVHDEIYKDCDLIIGAEVNVWGRRVVICDCDDFTKRFYRSKYGLEDFTPIEYKAPPAPQPPRPIPPYNGFGSEEDSLSSCQGLLPKPPQKDFFKFMAKDRFGLDSKVLSFRAKMVTDNEIDGNRMFIISFYLSDDSLVVFEHSEKNSGLCGGKFLARSRVKKPGQELFKSELSKYFTAQDLYVGAILCINSWDFQLLEADEYTLNYMEKHAEEFPRANLGNIFSKLRSVPEEKQSEIKTFLALNDPSNTGLIPYEPFRGLLMDLECGLSEHEVLMLARAFTEQEQPEMELDLMLAVAQYFLKKRDFAKFSDMVKAFVYHDRNKNDYTSVKDTLTICKAFKIPLPKNLFRCLLNKFADGDRVDYNAFVSGINWLENPTAPATPENILKFDVKPKDMSQGPAVKNLNYLSLLRVVFSNVNDPSTSTTTTTTASA